MTCPGQMHSQDGDVGGGDAADAQGLAEGTGGELLELLFGFGAQTRDDRVVDRGRDNLGLELGEAVDGSLLAGDVAVVFDADFDEAADVIADVAQVGEVAKKRLPT